MITYRKLQNKWSFLIRDFGFNAVAIWILQVKIFEWFQLENAYESVCDITSSKITFHFFLFLLLNDALKSLYRELGKFSLFWGKKKVN